VPEDAAKRYLAVIQFAPHISAGELAKRVPVLRSHISSFSNGEMEQFFRSPEGHLFGLLFKSAKPPPVMRSVLDAATTNADELMILEIGAAVEAKGFGPALTWLQLH
jgi:hypothetical protein